MPLKTITQVTEYYRMHARRFVELREASRAAARRPGTQETEADPAPREPGTVTLSCVFGCFWRSHSAGEAAE